MPKVSVKVRRPVSAPIPITPPALGGVAPLEKPNFVGGSAYKRKTSHLAVNGITAGNALILWLDFLLRKLMPSIQPPSLTSRPPTVTPHH